jgi:type II restriction/modification system DNA methylase subunit YeeA
VTRYLDVEKMLVYLAGGLARYIEAVERAKELDEKIQRTDDLIDEAVYDLFDLTEDEREVVEDYLDVF